MPYLIAYDLKSDKYGELETAIKDLGGWCKLQKSVWLTKNAGPSTTIRDTLSASIAKGYKLFVIKCGDGWASRGTYPTDVIDWVKKNL